MESNKQEIKTKLVIFDLDHTLIDWVYGAPKLYPQTEYVVEYLKERNMKMVIATYNKEAVYILHKLGIISYFDFIAIEKTTNIMLVDYKESILKNLLEKYNISPNEAIFFDDQPCNIQTAQQLGIKTVLVNGEGVNVKDVLLLV
jgi:putative hydrolase of the HAD superfamily